MKKIVTLGLLGLLLVSGMGGVPLLTHHTNDGPAAHRADSHFSDALEFSPLSLDRRDGYTVIDCVQATSYTMGGGLPRLPVVTTTYTLPFGTRVSGVTVTYAGEQNHPLPSLPAPAPSAHLLSLIETSPASRPVAYQQAEYPDRSFSYSTAAGLWNGQRATFLSVHLYPARYHSAANTVRYYSQATLDIIYTPAEPLALPDAYDLLILTPAGYTGQLQTLVDHKNANGVDTVMVTLDDIPQQGADIQESIKHYIRDAIEQWGITSVLLVGAGVEGEEQFPVRYAWIPSGRYEEKFPSDLYYADIYDANGSLSTWDADGDGKYAEYPDDVAAIDIVPDVYVARLPCNNAFELRTVVNKIVSYEESNAMTNVIVQIGGDTFPGDGENVNEGEFANEEVLKRLPGYESVRLWASTGDLTKGNIIRAINQGADFVDFSGHGSPLSWATHAPNDDEVWLPQKTFYSPYSGFLYVDYTWTFNLKKLPAVVFNACSCSKFSYTPDCISWVTLRKPLGGGIASFGASGIGYGSYGTSETDRLFGWMEVNLFEGMYATKVLGPVWGDAIAEYATSFDLEEVDYKTLLEMALFGDPTLAIADGTSPTPR
ncbi:MAG: C25 family cysteine peptidase [Candidatus Thermoplasmatota archaeon]|nr:C25 family cysteine peptidase [Candidatus Thermoplasmatota archaeon]MDD5778295.1 C25 family cysteine peptidase [Candidatus Thermoplasmatota archaeon]